MANVFSIDGIECEGCKSTIKEYLVKGNNIEHTDVSLEKKELIIRSDNEFSVADVQEIFDKNDL